MLRNTHTTRTHTRASFSGEHGASEVANVHVGGGGQDESGTLTEDDANSQEQEDTSGTQCTTCKAGHSRLPDLMLLCDSPECSSGQHMLCADPSFEHVPTGKWFCAICLLAMGRSQGGRVIVPRVIVSV